MGLQGAYRRSHRNEAVVAWAELYPRTEECGERNRLLIETRTVLQDSKETHHCQHSTAVVSGQKVGGAKLRLDLHALRRHGQVRHRWHEFPLCWTKPCETSSSCNARVITGVLAGSYCCGPASRSLLDKTVVNRVNAPNPETPTFTMMTSNF